MNAPSLLARLLAALGVLAGLAVALFLTSTLWLLPLPSPLRILAILLLVPTPALCVAGLGILAASALRDRSEEAARSAAPEPFAAPSEPALSCTGWKLAVLVTRGEQWWFAGTFHGSYTTSAVARCTLEPTHLPPVAGCSCGLHAFWTRAGALSYLDELRGAGAELSPVLLRVEAYGEVLTYEEGFRAESHDVLEVILPSTCACGAPTTHIRPTPARGIDEGHPACAACAGPGALECARLGEILGVAVTL